MQRRMGATECHQFILDYFHAHAIKGDLKQSRTYEVIEKDASHLKIRTRNKDGRSIQTLFADLMACKSLKYGEFRRVDLFWGMERKNSDADIKPLLSSGAAANDDSFRASIPGPTYLPNGELMPVDTFMSRRLGPAKRSRKEKAS